MGLFSNCNGLLNALSPTAQNGKSVLGTAIAPVLPLFLMAGNSSINAGSGELAAAWPGIVTNETTVTNAVKPWGDKTTADTNVLMDRPTSNITRCYEWNITRGVIAPDGYEKHVILVNDQFPGPLVEANWGETIEVKVNNMIDDVEEGTAIHWHGLLQDHTNWMDGVPGVSQCPIAPGKSFTYNFRATIPGSTWYHAHYSAQWAGGLFGPLVVYGPSSQTYDIDVGPILVGDWWHKEYFDVVEEIMAPGFGGRSFSDSNLINGKMNFDCSTKAATDLTPCTDNAGLAKFKFQSGKTHRLRFVNSGAQGIERVSIDGHTMTVFANDFTEIEPYSTKVVTLGIGQRVDVIVKADQGDPKSAFWLRSNLTTCSGALQPYARAAIFYEEADDNVAPTSSAWDVPDPGNCANDDLTMTKPLYKMPLPEASFTQHMDINVTVNETGSFLWTFNGVSARVDFNSPTLFAIHQDKLAFEDDMNVYNYGSNSSVRIIVNNPTPAPHPIHAHGVDMYVLASGPGNWDGTTIINKENPMRRDVQNLEPFGHVVVQMDLHNPGVWPFHCHIAWHSSSGLFSQMVFQPDEIEKFVLPVELDQTCQEWNDFTNRAQPNQIDSGL